jgi:predicted ATPase
LELTQFRITNYRSINDSGDIKVKTRTALVGRNESGKSNLLLALQSLNPPSGLKALSEVKDLPRDRPLTEFSPDIQVVASTWKLSDVERAELVEIFPRAKDIADVEIGRFYKATRYVSFRNLPIIAVDQETISQAVKKIHQSVSASVGKQKPANADKITEALNEFSNGIVNGVTDHQKWATETKATLKQFRQTLAELDFEIPTASESNLDTIDDHAIGILNDDKAWSAARTWAVGKLPTFIYLSDYPELEGHQSISEYLEDKRDDTLTEAHENFEKLCKVAGLNPTTLNQLLQEDHEKRQLLTNRAGAVVTQKIRQLWTDRALKIRFNLDADHLDTLISDPTAVYDVEVNLDERSRGFKWFFSFYVTFTADTAGGSAENAILLLDEPGLYLHAIAQQDLLAHFAKDFKNQIIYTTHSPFMIPVDDLDSIRTVNISQDTATVVSNDPVGDERTLFPIQTALGYNAAQSLFIGQNNLVVEGVSDFWYVSAASDYLNDVSGSGLPQELIVTPAGGAQRVSYMVTLLTSHRLRVLVLLDEESDSRASAENLVKSKMIRNDYVIFVSEAFTAPPSGGADIEDLLEETVFHTLVTGSYAKELAGKTLNLNNNIPRTAKRYEEAFKSLSLTFHKPRIARLFLQRIAENPASVMTPVTKGNFEALFRKISERLEAQLRRNAEPFR